MEAGSITPPYVESRYLIGPDTSSEWVYVDELTTIAPPVVWSVCCRHTVSHIVWMVGTRIVPAISLLCLCDRSYHHITMWRGIGARVYRIPPVCVCACYHHTISRSWIGTRVYLPAPGCVCIGVSAILSCMCMHHDEGGGVK